MGEHISIAFGPVQSRRLGWSLGVNNIPRKNCSYDCIYCQVGGTLRLLIKRQRFYPVKLVVKDVERKFKETLERGMSIDYISFVPDGEPTLDVNLGKEIAELKALGRPIAVFTNSSLLWMDEVREDLDRADLVSVKVDAVSPEIWKSVNRPHPSLTVEEVLEGIEVFAKSYRGKLITETMLVDKVDYSEEIHRLAEFIYKINPYKAYIAVPIRPPAVPGVGPASEETLLVFFEEFSKMLGRDRVELLTGMPRFDTLRLSKPEKEILEITSVHPMRLKEVERLLNASGGSWSIVEQLIDKGLVGIAEYRGQKFLVRTLGSRKK